jgi:hypothetical protein
MNRPEFYKVIFFALGWFGGLQFYTIKSKINIVGSGFGGLEDVYWPLVPKFTGSNPAKTVGFFRAKKSPARLPSEGK